MKANNKEDIKTEIEQKNNRTNETKKWFFEKKINKPLT